MKAIFIFLFLLISYVPGFSQNLNDEYTENDFIKRGSKKLSFIYTEIDTVTNKAKKPKTITVATFDPKSRIITIRYPESKGENALYVLTDRFNNLHVVNEQGKEDTVNRVPCPRLNINDTTVRECDLITISNRKGQVLKIVTDTNSLSLNMFGETDYIYSGDTLKKAVYKRFSFRPGAALKYDRNAPDEVDERIYKDNMEYTTMTNMNWPSKEIRVTKTILEKSFKSSTTKTYKNNKLTGIIQHIFE